MRRKLITGKLALALAGVALLAFAIIGCDNPVNGVNDNNISIFKNGVPAGGFDLWVAPYGGEGALHTVQLRARIIPGTEYYQNASWTSSSPERATVTNGGYVTAIAAGTVTITATTAAGRTDSVTINVRGYEPPTRPGDWSEHADDLIILHAAAVAGGTGNNAHRTFVELFNRSNATIDLDGLSLQWAVGQGSGWNVIPLSGEIPAGHSFLILGTVGDANARLQLPDTDADMHLPYFQLSNRAFRLALMDGIVPLTVYNPSDLSHEATDLRTLMPAANATEPSDATVGTEVAAGLIDLLGVVNTRTSDNDVIHGAKGAPAYRISNQTSIRRANLDDATNNFNDFKGIDWQARAGAVADDQIEVFRPRNLAYGAWTPTFPEPNWTPDPPGSVAIIGAGVAAGALTVTSGGPPVTLSAQFTPSGSDIAGVTFAWSVSSSAGVLTYGATNAATFAITGAEEGNATVTLNVTGGRITGTLTASVNVTVQEPSPSDGTVFASWNYTSGNFPAAPQSLPATFGSGGVTGTSLEFFYADGARATLRNGNRIINAPGVADNGWLPLPAGTGVTVQNSAAWIITLNTTGYENIRFSAEQASSNNGPGEFGLAWRVGTAGNWTLIPNAEVVYTDLPQGDTFFQTFHNLALPSGVENQAVVQIRVWISSDVNRQGATLGTGTGNTSINNIVFAGTSTDAGAPPIAEWNYTKASPAAPAWPATSGTRMTGTTLEFFYASGAQATFNTDGVLINVPNIGGNTVANGWFPTPDGQGNATSPSEPITVQNSAGWVIALSTAGYQNITFSAHQSASNNGPGQFRLAYRLDTSGAWTEFGNMVTIPGNDVDGGAVLHPTIANVSLPSTVNNQAVVQVRVWIATNARRSDGAALAANNGNHSINNILFVGDEI